MKHGAAVDANSPLHLGVGFAAGSLGVDPHLAAAVFIGTRVLAHAIDAGLGRALFTVEHGQSAANELTDLSLEVIGIYLGRWVRARAQAAPAAAAGLGIYPGECADGSGQWLPLVTPAGLEPICPSDPRWSTLFQQRF